MQRQKENGFACPAASATRHIGHINAPNGGTKPLNHCLVWMRGKDKNLNQNNSDLYVQYFKYNF